VKSVDAGVHEILNEMSDKEYLACRAIADTMPHLNRVFEEFGIHHKEHDVPVKVHKSLEDKAKKAAAKNATTMAKAKKRKGVGASKVLSKKQETTTASATTSAAASASVVDDVVENVGGGSASAGARMEGEHSATSIDLGGDTFVEATLEGMGGGAMAEASAVAPMPGILGNDLPSSKGEDGDGGDASPLKDTKVVSADYRPAKTPLV
jgi:hypothetical protein